MKRRTREMKVRMTQDEFNEISKTAESLGVSKQQFALAALKDVAILPQDELQDMTAKFGDCNRQLRGLAANVNQMARIANTEKSVPALEQLSQIADEIQIYRREADATWQSIRRLSAYQRIMEDWTG